MKKMLHKRPDSKINYQQKIRVVRNIYKKSLKGLFYAFIISLLQKTFLIEMYKGIMYP